MKRLSNLRGEQYRSERANWMYDLQTRAMDHGKISLANKLYQARMSYLEYSRLASISERRWH